MIQLLSLKYQKHITWPLFMLFYLQLIAPVYADFHSIKTDTNYFPEAPNKMPNGNKVKYPFIIKNTKGNIITKSGSKNLENNFNRFSEKLAIGGPASPEASSFKAAGADNLVNLFTGDFSYSIPLLDVGGYPVNLFYSGGITMDQDASWVGLGWNINPGTVSRNMRGIPDDFNGTDLLTQTQNVKPNRTWTGEIGVDGEILGIKPHIPLSLGFSYNNYLGPAIELGASISLSLVTGQSIRYEKAASTDLGLKLNLKLNSRSGLTLSPSLNARLKLVDGIVGTGLGISTSYNSRTGIKDLTIASHINFEKGNSTGMNLISSFADMVRIGNTISFARQSYMPTLRMPMENTFSTGQIEFGTGIFGLRGAVTANGSYAESRIAPETMVLKKPLVGFMFSEKATGNKDAVMDFNRLGDGEVTPNTPVISAPQYAYDIFSIQGEGTGGSIRAYRGDLGFMRDNVTASKDKSLSIGVDFAPGGHFGINGNKISSPTRVGSWEDGNNTLIKTISFKPSTAGNSFENVYFKNPAEATVANEEGISRIGGDNLVRFKLSGSNASPRLETGLEMFNKKTGSSKGSLSLLTGTVLKNREKRTQVTTMLTAQEATQVGLEKTIRNYTGGFKVDTSIAYTDILRIKDYRKPHHISEIDVLESNGMRYVYGIPVYNVTQKDYTFSVGNVPANATENLVAYDTTSDPKVNSRFMNNSSKIDGYVQTQETPGYASSFLITGLLSPDYVDVAGDGITEDDLGGAVKFDYTKSADLHKWRTPRKNTGINTPDLAHFNEGLRTEKRDNKATISYGEREVWYLSSIESKSMVAIFKTDNRNDAKGVKSPLDGSINAAENANKKLSRIDLYTKAEIRAKGVANARPLKSVFFDYGYSLCNGSPDNTSGGKLTLKDIYFTYNGQVRSSKSRYVFNYGDTTTVNSPDNPTYKYNAADRWGTYKDSATRYNPSNLTNLNFPFTDTSKVRDDAYAAAWSLKKILLPSGGQMEMQYEADDYAYVQDRRACNMMQIYGIGNTAFCTKNNNLYVNGDGLKDNYYVYIKLPKALINTDPVKRKREIFAKYIDSMNQIVFKLLIEMPNGSEPLTVYANYDDYGFCTNPGNTDIIYLKLRAVEGKSPLAKTAISFITGNLPAQAFPGYATEINGIPDFLKLVINLLKQFKDATENVDKQMRSAPNARTIVLASSFVRLNNPSRIKYGGGSRIKKVLLRDNWNKMTGQYNSIYGQEYDYTTTEKVDGAVVTISSGVASYEPGIGSEENPFREIVSFNNKLPLASAIYGSIEMPLLEALYPSACVGYSKVSVRSIHRKGTHGDSTVRSAIGKQVTEFFTARDYPSFSSSTPMNSLDYHKEPLLGFFNKQVISRRTISQGFLVETNDMHGKMKSQSAYSESDEKTPLSASWHYYKNTGKNGLNDQVDFVYNDQGGVVKKGNMGIDVELMSDVREFSYKSKGMNVQMQADIFALFPITTLYALPTYEENLYRAVTCTKLINYHAIEDSVVVMDKGSIISTKTIAYDAETGNAIVTQTANEFNDCIYNVGYPAYWAYSGTGPAYKNIGLSFNNVSFFNGKIISGVDATKFESGDELYVTKLNSTPMPATCLAESNNVTRLWVFDVNKNNTALTVPVKNLLFIDSTGKLFTKTGVDFKILRSGKRNNLALTVSSATCMKNPLQNNKLVVDNTDYIIAASAMEYKEKWQVDNDVILKKLYTTAPCSIIETESINCSGVFEKNINPYVKGLVGNLKPYRSYTYYGSRNESDATLQTSIRKNGYINNFSNYWGFNALNNLVPDYSNTKWVWNSELTKVNSKGQELETRDALNRYTAAQYGFNKNMPVALVQNARNGESFNEGFEDFNYAETLNKAVVNNCDNNKYFSFIGSDNSSISNTETSFTKSHSGKYALKVNSNTQAAKLISVNNNLINNTYNFNFKNDTAKLLITTGGDFTFNSVAGSYWNTAAADFGLSAFNVHVYPGATNFHYYNGMCSTYIQITSSQVYNFNLALTTNYNSTGPTQTYSNGIDVQIYDVNSVLLNSTIVSNGTLQNSNSKNYSVFLCPGIYKIVSNYNERYAQSVNYSDTHNSYSWKCSNCMSQDYKNLSTGNGCVFLKPLSATDSMLNQSFALVPGKRMQFSAWVKEASDSLVNYRPAYLKNHVELQFSGGNRAILFYPSGPIIEGWQKVEGEFTVPINASTANLVLSNDGNQFVYFDDIRMHPFNANMKSYVYDSRSLKLAAELDENNYASFYEYDEEGQLVRVKKETVQGIKTIKETRNAQQKSVTDVQ